MGKQILFATTNLSKKNRFQSYFSGLGLNVVSFADLGIKVEVPEDGSTPEENALKKAMAGHLATRIPTFGVDYWFRIEGLPDDKQPGPFVRRIFIGENGQRRDADDAELLEYYRNIVSKLGGEVKGTWTSAIALVISEDKYFTKMFTTDTLLVDKKCSANTPGEPMNSIQIEPITGKYLAELTKDEWLSRQNNQEKGYLEFMKGHLSDF